MPQKRKHVTITGLVQGVFFRSSMREMARELGIKGWVKNDPQGRVEAVVEGDEDALEKMIAWCHKGPGAARVESVDVEDETCRDGYDSFRILH